MTKEGFERACEALMHARTAAGDKCYFPQVWVSQDSPAFTEEAARRYNEIQHTLYKKDYTPIEVVTFEEAWKETHKGQEVPEIEARKICREINSAKMSFTNDHFYLRTEERRERERDCYQRNKERYYANQKAKREAEKAKKVKPNKK